MNLNMIERRTLHIADLSSANTVSINTSQLSHPHTSMNIKSVNFYHDDIDIGDIYEVTWNIDNQPLCQFTPTMFAYIDGSSNEIYSATYSGQNIIQIHSPQLNSNTLTFTMQNKSGNSSL